MSATPDVQAGRDRSAAAGKALRAVIPLGSHREFEPGPDRDPVGLLLEQAGSRIPELVPVRNGRMLVSPFTFYRGAALPMAADLAAAPDSGLRVQLCGDAHLANFGVFGSGKFDQAIADFAESYADQTERDHAALAKAVASGRAQAAP